MEPPLSDDPYSWIIQIVAFVMLFPFSVLFSASETAFISLSESELKTLHESDGEKEKKIYKLLSENSDNLLITFLLGNTLVNVSIATLAALLSHKFMQNTPLEKWGMFIEVFVVGTLILIIGEIIPKTVAIKNRLGFSLKVINIINFFYVLFTPLTYAIGWTVGLYAKSNKNFKGIAQITTRDIEHLMAVGGEEGVLEEDEKNMITSIFEFGDTSAKEIMVPRVDMKAIEDDLTTEELFEFIKETNFSRIPVYHENIDNIIGILYIKDLLNYLDNRAKELKISDIVREVTFIPESKDIGDLLKMFQKEKIHIAVVVDEYGGTAGMITLEDIIEEIVGEIQDEFDEDESLYKKINDKTYEVDARMPVDDLNELLGTEIPDDEDFESLGGFIYYIFGEVPEEGDKKLYEGFDFTVMSIDKQRIKFVKIEKK